MLSLGHDNQGLSFRDPRHCWRRPNNKLYFQVYGKPLQLSSCLPVFLCSCLSIFKCSCLSILMCSCVLVFLFPVFLSFCLPIFLSSYLPFFLSSCLPAFLTFCLPVCLSSCPPVFTSSSPPVLTQCCSRPSSLLPVKEAAGRYCWETKVFKQTGENKENLNKTLYQKPFSDDHMAKIRHTRELSTSRSVGGLPPMPLHITTTLHCTLVPWSRRLHRKTPEWETTFKREPLWGLQGRCVKNIPLRNHQLSFSNGNSQKFCQFCYVVFLSVMFGQFHHLKSSCWGDEIHQIWKKEIQHSKNGKYFDYSHCKKENSLNWWFLKGIF